MAPIKPKTLFAVQWFLITHYKDYKPTDNIYKIPEVFGNVGSTGTVDMSNEDNIHKMIKEEVLDFFNEYPHYRYGQYLTLYYIPFEMPDQIHDFEEIFDKECLTGDDYYTLINKLSQQKSITFRVPAPKHK